MFARLRLYVASAMRYIDARTAAFDTLPSQVAVQAVMQAARGEKACAWRARC